MARDPRSINPCTLQARTSGFHYKILQVVTSADAGQLGGRGMKCTSRVALLAVMLWSDPTHALPHADGGYMILGAGSFSCGEWKEARAAQGANNLRDTSWLLGFLTAFNIYGPGSNNITAGTDTAGRQAWVDSFCAQHPLAQLTNAAQALVNSKQAAPGSPPAE
jgi:hypothetical protein